MSCRYVPVHLWFFALFSTFAVLPAVYAAALWVGGSTIYYLSTVFGEPEHTGRALAAPLPGFDAEHTTRQSPLNGCRAWCMSHCPASSYLLVTRTTLPVCTVLGAQKRALACREEGVASIQGLVCAQPDAGAECMDGGCGGGL
jgi:hypothetical protein